MVTINLHGQLGENFRRSYKLNVKSVAEAIHAINVLNNGKLYRHLSKNQKQYYKVIVNNEVLAVDGKINDLNDKDCLENIKNSELAIRKKIHQIDIIPHLELHDSDILGIVLGAVLVIVGILLLPVAGPLGAALIVGGLGIMAAGVMNLLSKPPKFEDFREIGSGQKASYLFSGPTNVIGEGGPVPIGYGRLIVGSQTISASYDIYNIPIGESDQVVGGGGAIDTSGKERKYATNCGSLVSVDGWASSVTQSQVSARTVSITHTSRNIDLSGVTGPAPMDVYKTALLSNMRDGVHLISRFNYSFGPDKGDKEVTYKLHFAYWDPGNALPGTFDIIINGTTLHSSVNINSLAGAEDKAYIISGTANTNSAGNLIIELRPNTAGQVSNIAGIELYI